MAGIMPPVVKAIRRHLKQEGRGRQIRKLYIWEQSVHGAQYYVSPPPDALDEGSVYIRDLEAFARELGVKL